MIMLDSSRYREAYAAARRAGSDLDWLGQARDQALETLLTLGLPDSREEDWRYTNLDAFASRSLDYLSNLSTTATGAGDTADAVLPGWNGPRVALTDGIVTAGSSAADMPNGLQWQRLNAVPEEQRSANRARWWSSATDVSALFALNTAFLSDGVVLRTMARANHTAPLLVTFTGTGRRTHADPRLLVELAEHSSLTLVLHHCGSGNSLANVVTDIHGGVGSTLRLVRIQESGDEALHLELTRIRLEQGATARITTIDTGAQLARHDLQISLDGEGAGVEVNGLFLADGERLLDNHTRVTHNAPHTRSRETFRGIMDNNGRGVFNGKVVVKPGAFKTDAALTNRNLLLTRTAEIDTKPELEIFTDDVRCSHGATTGQLDPNAMFYLRSRGIDVHEARRLLVTAFAREIADSIDIAAVRSHLDQLLARRLATIGGTAAA